MWAAPFLLESLREVRLWANSGSCAIPWGFILLAVVLSFACGCCLGVSCAVVALSRSCRSLLLQLLGLVVDIASPTVTGGDHQLVDIRRRFSQYRA